MKRILAALGVTGLALLGAAAPATAGDDGDDDHRTVTICHATGSESHPYVQLEVDWHDLKAHAWHDDDIIPAGRKWDGKNWDADGQAIYDNGCEPCPEEEVVPPEEPVVVVPPVVVPPEEPVVVVPPVVVPPVVVPPVVVPPVVVPPVVTPIGAVVAPPAAPVAVVKNPGFNVQTAVASSDGGLAPWAAGLIVMVLAAGGVAARRTLPAGGAVSGEGKD